MTNPMTSIETKKKELADSLEAAADTVRTAADSSVHAINDLANQTGKKLDRTANSVRSWKLFGGLRSRVNRNPLQSIAVAAAVGLLAGASWKVAWKATR